MKTYNSLDSNSLKKRETGISIAHGLMHNMDNVNFYDGSTYHLLASEFDDLIHAYPKEYFLQTINIHWRDMDIDEALPEWLDSMKEKGAYENFMFSLDHMLAHPYPELCQDLHYWCWFELFHHHEGEEIATMYTTPECLQWLSEFKLMLSKAYNSTQ